MSSRACCLKIKECSGVIKGKSDGMIFLVEDLAKNGVEIPGDLEKRIVNVFDNAIFELKEINEELKQLAGI